MEHAIVSRSQAQDRGHLPNSTSIRLDLFLEPPTFFISLTHTYICILSSTPSLLLSLASTHSLDLSLPLNGSIDRSSPSWSTSLFSSYLTTINAFLPYNNILAFNVGNEVVNLPSNTNAAPFVKAAARDVKAYLKEVGSGVLVGYASVDGDEDFRSELGLSFCMHGVG